MLSTFGRQRSWGGSWLIADIRSQKERAVQSRVLCDLTRNSSAFFRPARSPMDRRCGLMSEVSEVARSVRRCRMCATCRPVCHVPCSIVLAQLADCGQNRVTSRLPVVQLIRRDETGVFEREAVRCAWQRRLASMQRYIGGTSGSRSDAPRPHTAVAALLSD